MSVSGGGWAAYQEGRIRVIFFALAYVGVAVGRGSPLAHYRENQPLGVRDAASRASEIQIPINWSIGAIGQGIQTTINLSVGAIGQGIGSRNLVAVRYRADRDDRRACMIT